MFRDTFLACVFEKCTQSSAFATPATCILLVPAMTPLGRLSASRLQLGDLSVARERAVSEYGERNPSVSTVLH